MQLSCSEKPSNRRYLQNWCEEIPGSFKFIIPDEQPLVTIDDIQNEALIGIWQMLVVACLVGQIQLLHVQVEAQAWHLVVHFQEDRFIGLDANDLQAYIMLKPSSSATKRVVSQLAVCNAPTSTSAVPFLKSIRVSQVSVDHCSSSWPSHTKTKSSRI